MTTPGDRPRGGFLANISRAMAPPIVEDDDPSVPLVRPRGVLVASVLVVLAALAFVFIGAVSLINMDRDLNTAVSGYNTSVATCQTEYGGIGTAAVAKPNATEAQTKELQTCQSITSPTVTPEMISNAKSRATMVSWVIVVFGLIALVTAWLLFNGKPLARRLLVGLIVLTMLGTMLLQISSPITLVGTLFIVVSVLLCYLGKGGVFFAKALLRQKSAR